MATGKKIQVTKITIATPGGSIELTIAEAKNLHAELADMFADRVRYASPIAPVIIQRPYYPQPLPYWQDRTTICGDNTAWAALSDGAAVCYQGEAVTQ